MGGGSCMIWGAFSSFGTSEIVFIDGRMNSTVYQTMLKTHLLGYMARWPHIEFIFQQDNAPVHASKSTREWLCNNSISVVEWPARSPDLNPIENIWGVLARDVYADCRQFSNVQEFKNAILCAWGRITEMQVKNLVGSMKNRMIEVLKKNDEITGY